MLINKTKKNYLYYPKNIQILDFSFFHEWISLNTLYKLLKYNNTLASLCFNIIFLSLFIIKYS